MKNYRKVIFALAVTCSLSFTLSHKAIAQGSGPVEWLTQKLNSYFKDSISMQDMVTDRYATFKTDAMQADMDGGMGRKAFRKKWKRFYNTSQQGLHEGFLIPLQDWQEITVQCRLISQTPQCWWIQVAITETTHQLQFTRNVLLVKAHGQLRIDDVQCPDD